MIVFGKGEDQVSLRIDGMFNERSTDFDSLLSQKCICLKLEENSEGFKNFQEFFYVASTPFIYFVAATGKLCEPIVGEAISERSIRKILEPPSQPNPSEQSTSDTPSTSTEPISNSELDEQQRIELIRQHEEERLKKQREIAEKTEEYRTGFYSYYIYKAIFHLAAMTITEILTDKKLKKLGKKRHRKPKMN